MLLLALMPLLAGAQVKHNFEKGPENTDCHKITFNHESESAFVADLKERTYRFTEELTISRYQSPRNLLYLSCDGKTGFVIAQLTEDKSAIHPDVTKTAWDSLLGSDDVIGYYKGSFSREYPLWKPQ